MNYTDVHNRLINADSFEAIYNIPDSVRYDLIYLDPPWEASFTQFKKTDIVTKEDIGYLPEKEKWSSKIKILTIRSKPFLERIYGLLKETGSLFVHCDYRIAGPLRTILQDIFGGERFIREFYWVRYRGAKNNSVLPYNCVDIVLWFTRSSNYHKNQLFQSRTALQNQMYKRTFNKRDEKGQYYLKSLKCTKNMETTHKFFEYKGLKGFWRCSAKKLDEYDKQNILVVRKQTICKKIYYEEGKTPPISVLWDDILPVSNADFSTAKPVRLYERLMELVGKKSENRFLDCFLGSGNSIVAARKKNWSWTGIESNYYTIHKVANRLHIPESEIIGNDIRGTFLKMPPNEFERAVRNKMNAIKKTDRGFDGICVGTNNPIQVKKIEKIGRNIFDEFAGAMLRIKAKKGAIIALSFADSVDEIVKEHCVNNQIDILYYTLDEILRGKHFDDGFAQPLKKQSTISVDKKPKGILQWTSTKVKVI